MGKDTSFFSPATSTVAATLAAIGASACCAGPLILVLLGVGGAWSTKLTALEAYQGYFLAATVVCFGYAFYSLYLKRVQCAPDQLCAVQAVKKRQRMLFWVLLAFAVGLVALPLYAPLIL